jgi:hypothetical protein
LSKNFLTVSKSSEQSVILQDNETKGFINAMAKHKSWHGADIKRARKKKEAVEKRKRA